MSGPPIFYDKSGKRLPRVALSVFLLLLLIGGAGVPTPMRAGHAARWVSMTISHWSAIRIMASSLGWYGWSVSTPAAARHLGLILLCCSRSRHPTTTVTAFLMTSMVTACLTW
jgi:hypothetical protein